jgi:hypothetical protein
MRDGLDRFRALCDGVSLAPPMYGTPAECAATLYGASWMVGCDRDEWLAALNACDLLRGNTWTLATHDDAVRLARHLSEVASQWSET